MENYWTRAARGRTSRRRLLGAGATGLSALALAACSGSNNNNKAAATVVQPTSAGTAAAPATSAGTAAGTARPATAAAGSAATAAPSATTASAYKPGNPHPRTLADVSYTNDLRDPGLKPKAGGTLKQVQSNSHNQADPAKSSNFTVPYIFGHLGSTLLAHDGAPGVGYFEDPIVGDVASKWQQPDDMTFVFSVDPKAKWQNKPPANGRAVNAADVLFSFQRWQAGDFTKSRFTAVDKLEAVDPATFKVTMKRPVPEMLDTFAFEFHPIVNKEYLDTKNGEIQIGSDFVGSGPFLLTDWQNNVTATWTKNPDYWATDKQGNKLPYVDKITWTWILDPAAQQAAFQTNQIDSVSIRVEQFDDYAKMSDVSIGKSSPAAGMLMIGFNHRNKPYNDPRVRQAVSMASDRLVIASQVYNSLTEPAVPFPPKAIGQTGLPKWQDLPPTLQHNVAQAKQLLAAAGFPNGLDVGNLYVWVTSPDVGNVALTLQQQWKDAGINSKINQIQFAQFDDLRFNGKWDGIMVQFTSSPGVNSQGWADWMHTGAALNYWGISDPQVDQIVEKLTTTLDNNQRMQMFQQLQKIEYDNVFRGWLNQLSGLQAFRNTTVNVNTPAFLEYKYFANKYVWFNK